MSLKEGDILVTESSEVSQCQARRQLMIEHDIGHAINVPVARNRYGGQRQLFIKRSIRGNEPFNPPGQQHLRVSLQQLRIVPMNYGEEEKIMAAQVLLNAADDHR